jgi:hypothetical protein
MAAEGHSVMSRRLFVTGALALVLAGLLGHYEYDHFTTPKPEARPQVEADPLKEIEARYNIECVVPATPLSAHVDGKEITARPVNLQQLKWYPRLFAEEFLGYPPSLIRSARLKRVVFCQELAEAGQPRGGLIVYQQNTIYFNVRRDMAAIRSERWAIHHELFHALDHRDDPAWNDRWTQLNPPGFNYGTLSEDGAVRTAVRRDIRGFVTWYATTSVSEDRAEMFASMRMSPSEVKRLCDSDVCVRAKVQLLKEFIADLSPDANEKFWPEP